MPQKMVKNVVTPRVLEMDRRSCDHLLMSIYEDKSQEDRKQALIQKERLASRNKLAMKHNERIAVANRIGVKVKSKMTVE